MKRMFALVAGFLLIATAGLSQNTTVDSVKLTVSRFYGAIQNSDGYLIRQLFTDSATLQTINRDKNGEAVVKATAPLEFALLITRIPKGLADQRISFDMVKVDGPLAVAWVPYKFYSNGQLSHCGVSSIQLIRIRGVWRIQYLIDTQRRSNCE
jgi:hypothetical protein